MPNGPSLTAVLFAGGLVFVAGYAAGGGWALPREGVAQTPAPPPTGRSAATEQRSAPAGTGPAYPAELLHVNDGDTFEAQVQIWPGMQVTTKVRLRGVDAPEKFGARCESEYRRAVAAEDALRRLLQAGGIVISRVAFDKYGGRVLADAATRETANVSEALLASGLARPYEGGRRGGWCSEAAR